VVRFFIGFLWWPLWISNTLAIVDLFPPLLESLCPLFCIRATVRNKFLLFFMSVIWILYGTNHYIGEVLGRSPSFSSSCNCFSRQMASPQVIL
jgi:hypothetical protein